MEQFSEFALVTKWNMTHNRLAMSSFIYLVAVLLSRLPVTDRPLNLKRAAQPSDLILRAILSVDGLSKRGFKAPPRAWLIGTPLSPTGHIGTVRWWGRRDLSR